MHRPTVSRIRHYWEIRKVVNGYKSAAASSYSFILIRRWRDWYHDTVKTCRGGGMHCPSASSLLFTYVCYAL